MDSFIYNNIQQPIDLYLEGRITEKEIDWWGLRSNIRKARKKMDLFREVHEVMMPYYRKLLLADDCFFRNKNTDTDAKTTICLIMKDEGDHIGRYLSDIDIVKCAENWGKHLSLDNHQPVVFFMLIKILIQTEYDPDWEKVAMEIRTRLSKAKEFGDYKQHEMYCIVMAFLLVFRSDLPESKKVDYYDLIHTQWDFLKYMYSVMIKYIVGMKLENFAGVANSVARRKSCYPYMHLFYKAFKESFDELCPKDMIDPHTHRYVYKQAEVHLKKMEDIIKTTPTNNDLTPLCEILFPKKMKSVLNQQRPKTYAELEHDIDLLTNSYNDMVTQMAESVKAAVSIEEIDAAFSRFSAELALAFFTSINSLLVQNETWLKYAPALQRHILERQAASSSISIANNFGPLNGSIQQQTLQIPSTIGQDDKHLLQS